MSPSPYVAPPEMGQTSRPSKRSPAKARNTQSRLPTILVVEDEVLVRMAVAEYLRDREFRVLEASNAQEAQALFAGGEPIAIVFSDIQMPGGMNGFGLAKWIRASFPDVKVMLTSGIANLAATAEEFGNGPVLAKPYAYETLAAQIRRLLGTS
jgi:CheY-like chemotaxis protein